MFRDALMTARGLLAPLALLALLALPGSLLAPALAGAAELAGPYVKHLEGNIHVDTSITLASEELKDIRKGISKEVVFYIDLFRVWNNWPDEFIAGTKFKRTILCDPIKREYVSTSLNESQLIEKRFSNCEDLLVWALSVEDHMLSTSRGLAAAPYYVKVKAESRLRRLPPVVGYLFFFVKEKEFEITGTSTTFRLGDKPKGAAR